MPGCQRPPELIFQAQMESYLAQKDDTTPVNGGKHIPSSILTAQSRRVMIQTGLRQGPRRLV